ncbi:hypothetical protein [uncultured Pseudoflavonifractor sp.]|uniref:hypothetical protein n=1 Tax=uncultured Pseudoflavonifractor sp. TaxID=1221379 RepID=UPI0025EA51EB|nr:hypothetical protein [uncultured Pseudoflavonifractor sp.]
MENPILRRLREGQGVDRPDPVWLLTLLTAQPLDTYSLEDWNEALSLAVGRRILCPSYRTLSAYVQRLAVDSLR